MYYWVRANAADERKPKDTEALFIYKARKKAVGPFKKHFWSLPEEARTAIGASLEKTFAFLFEQLAVSETKKLVAKFVTVPKIHQPVPAGGVKAGKRESVDGLAD
jgi:hypothetical protein